MLYKITRITRPNGEPATDTGSIHRIGTEGHLLQLEIGRPMVFAFTGADEGTALQTSKVLKIRSRPDHTIQITTKNNSYYLTELDPTEFEALTVVPK